MFYSRKLTGVGKFRRGWVNCFRFFAFFQEIWVWGGDVYIRKKDKLIQGVGINDADYKVTAIKCPYYLVWTDMIRRAYDQKYTVRMLSYVNVIVCDDWIRFSGFRKWMIEQDWEGKTLDKDLIKPGNKVYGPETCCFLSMDANQCLTYTRKQNNGGLVSVRYPEKDKINPIRNCTMSRKFGCNNPKTARIFDTAEDAYLHWAKYKRDVLINHSKHHDDFRVKGALIKYGLMLVSVAEDLIKKAPHR